MPKKKKPENPEDDALWRELIALPELPDFRPQLEGFELTRNQERFLVAYANTGIPNSAAAIAGKGCSVRSHQRWLKPDDDGTPGNAAYAEAFAIAHDWSIDLLVAEAQRRGRDGTVKPIYYQGMVCGAIREYSDGLLRLLLEARRPEEYRSRHDVNLSALGPDALSLMVTIEKE